MARQCLSLCVLTSRVQAIPCCLRHVAIGQGKSHVQPSSHFLYRYLATQPAKEHLDGKPIPKSGKSADSEIQNESLMKLQPGEHITLFHKPSSRLIDIQPPSSSPNVTLFFRKNEDVINVMVQEALEKLEKEEVREGSERKIESIDELMWRPVHSSLRQLPDRYLRLAKVRLTGLVVLTTMGGYAMAPGAFELSTFLLTSLGTALSSASANSINQYLEVPYDSQMSRTKNRVLVRGQLSPLHAVSFAAVSGIAGVSLLTLCVNPLTGALGLTNLLLYTAAYTPMKRLSIWNTWVGSVVGAIPPMMGWAAATGQLDIGCLWMGAILYAWQFPHFNALSWNLRADYSRAGYRMSSVIDPKMCKRVAFRYCIGMIPLCTVAPLIDVTTWSFAIDSLPLNLYLSYLGWNFYRDGDSKSSRKLFRFTLVHIPMLMILMLISKKRDSGKNSEKAIENTSQTQAPVPV